MTTQIQLGPLEDPRPVWVRGGRCVGAMSERLVDPSSLASARSVR